MRVINGAFVDERHPHLYGAALPESPSHFPYYKESDFNRYVLGNDALPIWRHKQTIVDTVNNNPVTILRARTGSGKSTQAPQFFLEAGYSKVVLTQPRILASRSLSERIAFELNDALPIDATTIVGYRTAEEGNSTPDTRIEVVTDGLQLAREMNGNGIRDDEVMIIDEAHENGVNQSMLIALALRHNRRLVISSATINTEGLQEYLSETLGRHVPIIDIEGTAHPITEITADDYIEATVQYAKQGLVVLGFLPGKPNIERVKSELRKQLRKDHAILELHGEQSTEEQSRVFRHYPEGKIILSTDIGKTSITIPDADVVIDCGYERAGCNRRNVQTLDMQVATNSTSDQRKGRIGRTKPGIYVEAPLATFPPLPHRDERPQYDTPHIVVNRPDTLILRMLGSDAMVKFEDLELMHRPEEDLHDFAKLRLQRLGAIATSGEITDIGKEMAKISNVDTHYARMIVESRKYSKRVQVMLLAAVAAHGDSGIISTMADADQTYGKLTDSQDSDILMLLDIFIAAQTMSREELKQFGIVDRKFDKANTKFTTLLERLGLEDIDLEMPSYEDEQELIDCIISGADELFVPVNRFKHLDPRGYLRRLGKNSPLRGAKTLAVGTPYDIANLTQNGKVYRNTIQGATRVTKDHLLGALSHRCTFEPVDYIFGQNGEITVKQEILFDEMPTNYYVVKAAENDPALIETVSYKIMYDTLPKLELPRIQLLRKTIASIVDFQHRSTEPVEISEILDAINSRLADAIPSDASTLQDIDTVLPTVIITDYIAPELLQNIHESTPDYFMLGEEVVPIVYKKGKAYITLPAHIDPYVIIENTPLDEERIRVHYRNLGKGYHSMADARAILRAKPRKERRTKKPTDSTSTTNQPQKPDVRPLHVRENLQNLPPTHIPHARRQVYATN